MTFTLHAERPIDYAIPCEPLVNDTEAGAEQTAATALACRLRLRRGYSATAA